MTAPAKSRILDAIIARMKEEYGEEFLNDSNLENRIIAGINYRVGEIVADNFNRLPRLQRTGDPGEIQSYWWNWGDLTVGYAVDGGHLVVFEMKTTKHLLCEDSFADHLMELIEHAATHGSPYEG